VNNRHPIQSPDAICHPAITSDGFMSETPIPAGLEDDVLLSKKQVRQVIPYSGVHIDRLVKSGKFPPPIIIGHQHFWRTGTIRALVRALAEAQN
jgi:predicted DNA-binding transcriptional regulator AlpA